LAAINEESVRKRKVWNIQKRNGKAEGKANTLKSIQKFKKISILSTK
jgi:hypothetical protein